MVMFLGCFFVDVSFFVWRVCKMMHVMMMMYMVMNLRCFVDVNKLVIMPPKIMVHYS